MKLVSVIVPVYNAEKYLVRLLNSLLRQTIFEKLEIILIDDGSKDNSLSICEKYSDKYSNISVFHKENGGVSSARNVGLEKVTTDYICFMDSDDEVECDFYQRLYSSITENDADMAMVDFKLIFPDGKIVKKKKEYILELNQQMEILKSFFVGGTIGNQVVDKIFKKESLINVVFDETKRIGEDMLFIYEFLKQCNRVYIDTTYAGYIYYINDESAMNAEFKEKYFEPVEISKLMHDEVQNSYPLISNYAYAHYIHEICKLLERMQLKKADKKYEERKCYYFKLIKKYSLFKAYKYLSFRQASGIFLMKISPRLYMYFYSKMRIG